MPAPEVHPEPIDLLRKAFAQTPGALFLFGSHGLLLTAEGSALPSLGAEAHDAIGHTVETLFPGLPDIYRALNDAFTGIDAESVVELRGRTWLVRHRPVREADSIVGVAALWVPAPEDSRNALSHVPPLYEAEREGLLLHAGGRIVAVNRRLAEMLGYATAELQGMLLQSIFTYGETNTRGEGFEVTCLRRNGSSFQAEVYARETTHETHEAQAWSIWDITRRRHLESALRETDARYKALFYNAGYVVFTIDLAGNFTSVNPAVETVTGYSRAELLTMSVRDLVVPRNAESVLDQLQAYVNQPELQRFELDILTKDGRTVSLEVNACALYHDDMPVGLQGVAQDVTPRKQMERALQYRLEIERLLSSISTHFINVAGHAVNDAVADALATMAQFVEADRAWLYLTEDALTARCLHEWVAEGVMPAVKHRERLVLHELPWLMAGLEKNQPVFVDKTHDIPGDAPVEQRLFGAQLSRGFLAVPMVYGGGFIGFLGLDAVRGEPRWNEDTVVLVKLVGEILANALERKRSEEALRISEERYKLAARAANDGLWDWDLDRNKVYYSPRWKSLLGYGDAEIDDSPDEWIQRIHPDERADFLVELDSHINGRTEQLEIEQRMQHRDGSWVWMLTRGIAVRNDDGRVYRIAGSQADITKRKEAEQQLTHDALHDALTGIANRALLIDRLGASLRRAKRKSDAIFAVLFMDLDRFKVVNDGLGHAVGDELLIAIARRLETCLRPGDTVARLGGDEFVVLLEDLSYETDATRVAERIHQEMLRPFHVSGHELFTSFSIGINLYDGLYEKPEDMLRDADMAMYRAKKQGAARYSVFDSAMHVRAVEKLRLESDVRKALDNGELHLHYQPIVSLRTMQLTGFEALLRWRHPERGDISPDQFIPLIEENGLIMAVGKWVLLEACRQVSVWQAQFRHATNLTLAVNLSPKQFAQADLPMHVGAILTETGLTPGTLRLEITESVLMEHADQVARLLQQLRDLNCRLQIDDFGTGYSSLAYLHRYPFEGLKIDRTFLENADTNEHGEELVRGIVSLGQALRMGVIAEGVETQGQVELLRAMGCDYAQGYYFSRPLGADTAAELLRSPLTW